MSETFELLYFKIPKTNSVKERRAVEEAALSTIQIKDLNQFKILCLVKKLNQDLFIYYF